MEHNMPKIGDMLPARERPRQWRNNVIIFYHRTALTLVYARLELFSDSAAAAANNNNHFRDCLAHGMNDQSQINGGHWNLLNKGECTRENIKTC